MKNLINKIDYDELEVENLQPYEIEGYYNLKPKDQIIMESLPQDVWKIFVIDTLQAYTMDNLLAEFLEQK